MRVRLELQTSQAECGLACLAMIAGTYDKQLDLLGLRHRWPGSKHGLTLRSISSCAQQLGFMSRGLRCEPLALKQIRTPAILHWDMDHFVVLASCGRRGCMVFDPAVGRKRYTWDEVDKHFTGVVLEIWPGAQFRPAPASRMRLTLRDLWPLGSIAAGDILKVVVLSILLQGFVLALPWHMQWTIDEAIVAGDVHLIGVLAMGFGVLLGVRVLTHWLRGALTIYVGHLLSFQFACHLLRHLLRLPLDWYEQRHAGDIVSRFDALAPVRDLLTQGAAAILVDAIMVVLAFVLMLVYAPDLALLVLVVHALLAVVYFLFVPRLKDLGMSTVVAQAAEQSHLLESVRSVHNLKLYAQESARERQWQKLHAQTLDASMQLQRTQLGVGTFIQLVGGVELLVIVYFAATSVMAGVFTLGMLFAFVSFRGHFADRARSLMEQLVALQTIQVHLQRLAEIWREPMETIEIDGQLQAIQPALPTKPEPLTLSDVGYRHSIHSPWVLQRLSMEVGAGEFVAIIGSSGVGKTTLMKLMMGLVVPQEGQVCLGGARLGPARQASYRREIGCVLQADGLFGGTIADNVALWREPDPARLQQVLAQVDILPMLAKLPMGVATRIGEIGSGLSSGQVQRLLLARALYDAPNYLFLDEGTANLDAVSAAQIQEVVAAMRITRVVVTHDLAFAARADRVLCMTEAGLAQVAVEPAGQIARSVLAEPAE